MTHREKYHVPVITAIWLIVLPLVFAFLAGAGADTVFDGLATFFGTMFAIYGGPSLLVGVVLLLWVGSGVLRGGGFKKRQHLKDA